VLLIDVDHFKKFNDQFGHQAGDVCLRSVARILAEQARRPADLWSPDMAGGVRSAVTGHRSRWL